MATRIVIIGAGVIGASLAAELADVAGTETTLVEAKAPGRGTSATSLAWLNANRKTPREYHDLNVRGMQGWARLSTELGSPRWYRPTGNLIWATGESDRAELDDRVDRLQAWAYRAERIPVSRVSSLEPEVRLPADALVASFPDEAHLHGERATNALVDLAVARGCRLVTHDRVEAIDVRNNRVTHVRLASGQQLSADVIAVCAGWLTNHVLAQAGTSVPLVEPEAPASPAQLLVARTTPDRPVISRLVQSRELKLRPTEDGVQLEASDINASVDARTSDGDLDAAAEILFTRARTIVPALRNSRIAFVRRCVRPLPLDGYPIVGWTGPAGLYVLVTHSGITLAPELARLASKEILGDDTDNLAAYRPDRPSS